MIALLMTGTGKTLLAKAVANQTSATFLRVVGSELIQKYLGDGPKLGKIMRQIDSVCVLMCVCMCRCVRVYLCACWRVFDSVFVSVPSYLFPSVTVCMFILSQTVVLAFYV